MLNYWRASKRRGCQVIASPCPDKVRPPHSISLGESTNTQYSSTTAPHPLINFPYHKLAMSTKQDAGKSEPKTKKFGKGERTLPHHTQKAKKFYPVEDESKPKKVCNALLEHFTSWKTLPQGFLGGEDLL